MCEVLQTVDKQKCVITADRFLKVVLDLVYSTLPSSGQCRMCSEAKCLDELMNMFLCFVFS